MGCNLLREGLDLPEVSLVCVLNADKQGLLRSTTSLIQTIGRAARHVNGVALLYSESGRSSEAMEQAIAETNRRRAKQLAHNERNLIVPRAAGTALGADGAAEPRAPDGGGASILEMLARGGGACGVSWVIMRSQRTSMRVGDVLHLVLGGPIAVRDLALRDEFPVEREVTGLLRVR